MIIKLAFDPFITGAALVAAKGIPTYIGAAIGNQMHDLPHFLTARSNKFGKFIQRSVISDSIIAAKKGTEGKILANRKLMPTAFFSGIPGISLGGAPQEGKSIAVFEANLLGHGVPGLKHMFKGNKLQVDKVKNVLGGMRAVDRSAGALQVATPAFMGVKGFKDEYDRSGDWKKASKRGLMGVATGGIIAGGLEIPRRLASKGSQLHHILSKDKGYGYNLLEEASKHAAKSMNRPKMFNYSNFFYKTPQENLNAFPGKMIGNSFQRIMGQKRAKGYDSIKGYDYGDTNENGAFGKVIDKVDHWKKKIEYEAKNRI
jgi:hypothetical protein